MKKAIILYLCLVQAPLCAVDFVEGTGEPNDPYQIDTAEQLIGLGEDPNLYDQHFVLTADIDLDPNLPGGRVFDRAVIAPDVNTVALGFQGVLFSGSLDGQGFSIINMHMQGDDCLGLFGVLDSATITNLRLSSVQILGRDFLGAIAGESYAGQLSACFSSGRLQGIHYVAGLVGSDRGEIRNWSIGQIGTKGGLVEACGSSCECVGEEVVAGLLGRATGDIFFCYSMGDIRGRSIVGGLVGVTSRSTVIRSSYSRSPVSGDMRVGGLIGHNAFGIVDTCYSSGSVSGAQYVYNIIGGLIGTNYGRIYATFWDSMSSGMPRSFGGTGLTTAQMQDINTFLEADWDFIDETANGTENIWWIDDGNDYPRLWWELDP